MLQHLKPTEAAIEKLALAETDRAQLARFTPLRWGFAGNLMLILVAGLLGFGHAVLAALGRGVLRPFRDGRK